jgi:hypothetical protein
VLQNLSLTVEVFDGSARPTLLSNVWSFSYDPPAIVAFDPSPLLMDGSTARTLRVVGGCPRL